MKRLQVYSDGASRGNPGPAAIAVKIIDEDGAVLKRASKFLGQRTNNEAEYEAVAVALELAHSLAGSYVDCFLDSELVVKQLRREYSVRNPRLERLWLRIHELQQHFQKVSFNHVTRTNRNIKEVDKLANRTLDKRLG